MENSGWINFWVNEREAFVKIMALATDFFANQFARKFGPLKEKTVLDFGCGPGLLADSLKSAAVKITGADINQFFLDEYKRKHPEAELIRLPNEYGSDQHILKKLLADRTFDYIILLSITQYFSDQDDLSRLLRVLKGCLKDGGKIIVADVVPPGHSSVSDGLSLLKHSLRRNHLVEMMFFINYVLSSRYRKHSSKTPLLSFSQDKIEQMATNLGLTCQRVAGMTIHSTRLNFVLASAH